MTVPSEPTQPRHPAEPRAPLASVRPAELDDIDAFVEVGRRTWPQTYAPVAGDDYVALGLAKWWTPEAVRPLVEAGRALVAEVDGHVVGVSAVGPLHGDLVLFRLYVLPEHQGRGIGQQLIDEVFERARETGHRILRVSYLDGNDAACAFYARNGFRESHREATGDGIPALVWAVHELWEPEP